MTRMMISLVAALLLSACAGAQTISSDVTRFHQMPPPGGTVAIVAPDDRKSGGMAFRDYAARTTAHLSRAGFSPVSGAAPDYIAELDYYQQPVASDDGIDNGPRMSLGVGGGSGGYGSGVGVGLGTSFSLGGGERMAARTVTLVISRRDTGARIFEGRAQSMGPADNFAGAVPYMIDALFSNFPGQSGQTITVEAAIDRKRR
ncbi:DUF4136 domain-containing protein [Iodidimonas sp. SYSU 1G8]|uniref:DUF4136 domain-containing protein n=1 Tax=Iodidimonas sp. SYSU 1G8 TaxID=3133967 RepID=UPI0031FEE08C